ncbi:CUB domain-containing protein [Labilibaculum antarcticum]|uniref:CUB domain-containing protein n=1 Tax=Labilibaculum antarcticum TaxID=1717717 RepID=A0A1Y1CJW1_9BACT|nr:CUB domain-containing protein [Labilibaculum antarcticum]BAX80688.1 hypothetical protein ALGA_2361 [Labilibaculum antarcticum]
MNSKSPVTVSTGDYFYDDGKNNDYSKNKDYTLVLKSAAGTVIRVTFESFDIESQTDCNYDWLKVFDEDGTTMSSLRGKYCGLSKPSPVLSTGSDLTFQFHSDGSVENSGWKAVIEVLDPNVSTVPTVADCLGAKTICNSFYDEPSPEIEGQGNVTNELPTGDCIPDEKNGIWYAFSPQNDIDAELKFSITPSNSKDDYDWVIFDVTDVTCEDLSSIDISTSDVFISGNTYGANNNNETGADSDQGSGNCNGPGTSNGPKWNADIPVKPNRNYVLYVSNWSESNRGYTINFNEGGTAIIYDDVLPDLDGVVQACYGEDKLKVEFSEIIPCGSLNKNDITVQIGGVAYGVADISSSNCDLGGVGSNSYIIFLDEIIADSGLAEIKITAAGIMDMCGNVNDEESTLTFTVSELTASLSVDKNPACADDDIVITANASGGTGVYTYEFFLNNTLLVSNAQYSITDNQLSSKVFVDGDKVKVEVLNENACSTTSMEINVVISSLPAAPTGAGAQSLCSTSTSTVADLSAIPPSGSTVNWYPAVTGGTVLANTEVLVNGTTYYAESENIATGCLSSSRLGVGVAASEPVINIVTAANTTCVTSIDGQIVVNDITIGSGAVEYSIDGANWQASNIFTGLSAGNYDVKIRAKIGVGYCESASKSVSVDNPTAITISQSNLIDATCSANTDGEININVSGGDQVMSFDGTDSYIALDLNYNSTTAIPEMTVAAWVKVGPASGGGGWSILDFDRSEYFNFTIGGINASDVYHVSFNTRSPSGNIHDFNSLSTIGDDQWHFVVGVYDGTDKYIYIDGELDSSTANPHSGSALGSSNTRYAFIGTGSEASTFDGAKNGGRIFDGNIADVWYFESSITSTDELKGLSQGTIPGGHTAKGHWRLNDISNGFISNLVNSDSYGQVFGMDASNITAANLYTFSCTKDGASFSLDGNISEEDSNNYKLSNLAVGDYVLTVIDHKGCTKNTLFTIENGDISLPVIIGLNDVNMCALDALTQKAIVSGIELPDVNYTDNCGGVLTVQYQIKAKDDAVLVDFGDDSDGDASGFEFPEGVNTVTYEVTDAVGLSSEMSFKVTIQKKPNPIGIFGE